MLFCEKRFCTRLRAEKPSEHLYSCYWIYLPPHSTALRTHRCRVMPTIRILVKAYRDKTTAEVRQGCSDAIVLLTHLQGEEHSQ